MGPSPGVVALLAAASGSPPANFDLNGSWRNSVHRTAASPASVTNAVAPTAILNVLFRISPPPWRNRVSPWPEPQRGNPLFRKGTLRRSKERSQEYSPSTRIVHIIHSLPAGECYSLAQSTAAAFAPSRPSCPRAR